MTIRKNAVICRHCNGIIESTFRDDMVTCECGRVTIEGGHEILIRHSYSPEDYEDISILED